jgi:hypothetical protein
VQKMKRPASSILRPLAIISRMNSPNWSCSTGFVLQIEDLDCSHMDVCHGRVSVFAEASLFFTEVSA